MGGQGWWAKVLLERMGNTTLTTSSYQNFGGANQLKYLYQDMVLTIITCTVKYSYEYRAPKTLWWDTVISKTLVVHYILGLSVVLRSVFHRE